MADRWPDWYLETASAKESGIRTSMLNLARYTNPAQTVRHGLGLGTTHLLVGQPKHDQAEQLAERVISRRVRYTREPFSPGRRGQIIRTTQELFDGSGTCVDFAVTMAAMLNREDIPAVLAVALPTGVDEAHAFILAYDDRGDDRRRERLPLVKPFEHWYAALTDPDGRYLLLDVTPSYDGEHTSLAERRAKTLRHLQSPGVLYALDVRSALADAKVDYYLPPPAHRNLGITAFLPDPVPEVVHFPSRREPEETLAATTGRVLLVGESGTGKSTLALERATEVSQHRGWFLDGSDPETLRRSLAAAEAQSRGEELGPVDADNLRTRTSRAHYRLASSERPWVVVVDNANHIDDVLPLLPVPRPASPDRAADLLIVTSTDEEGRTAALKRSGWTVVRLDRLRAEDARAAGSVWSLLTETERLPGLLRIATWCAAQLTAADHPGEERGAARIVCAALRRADSLGAAGAAMARAVSAVSFMPAEQVTVDWVARAAFAADVPEAAAALGTAEGAGIVERSRADDARQLGHYPPLWMHRLVRSAVQELATRETGLRVLATYDGLRYSVEETTELHRFVCRRSGLWTSVDEVLAAATVVDLLETRGEKAVRDASLLAEAYVDRVDPLLDIGTSKGISVYVRAQMAATRPANHNKATAKQIEQGLARCTEAASACTRLVDSWNGGPDRDEVRLLRGRAEAMHGILLRKQASAIETGADDARKERLYRECIDILTTSYEERRSVFQNSNGTLKPDPDRHVDRGWYNLGGANIALANLLHHLDPTDAGETRIAEVLSEATAAYAGSLSLRRPNVTNYTAASLWGVALSAYSAALYCPGRLDLSFAVPTEELNAVRNVQTRETLLGAAENCAMQALWIWTELNGYPNNARLLLRKISLAWAATDPDPAKRSAQLAKALEPVLQDLELVELHVPTKPEKGV